ncbi:MAG: exonuclease domain-containing protein, partial [Candidatus Cloacimonadota bacterium]|nr:exonuclease domain-containing protein [Candidatus Cloacimonadota bacterium]
MAFYNSYVVLDLETTGFNVGEDEIIEIGAVKYENNNLVDEFSEFVHPQKKVPEFIKQLTNITDQQLAEADNLPTVIEKFQKFIGNNLLICHNTNFDINFLKTKFDQTSSLPLINKFIDTLKLSRIYLPFIGNHKLTTLCKFLDIDLQNAHRAIYDAKATANLFQKLEKLICETELPLNNQLLQIARIADLEIDLVNYLEKIVRYQQHQALLKKNKTKAVVTSRNYLKHDPEEFTEYTISEIFDKDGIFYNNFRDYELRSGQMQMAEAVLGNLLNDEVLLVEAGTGVGKSLAYLIPALIHTNQNQCKVIISTNTKNLQEQLFYKDLPLVKSLLNLPFEAVLLKGRRNYLCLKKWNELILDPEKNLTSYEAAIILDLLVWEKYTKTGDISENSSFNEKRHAAIWKKISADQHFCNKRKCKFYNSCYLMDVREKAENAHLVIINHHLLLADLQTENSALGNYDYLIVDEAHNLPHLAPVELGLSLSYADIINFFNQIYSIRNKFQSGSLVYLKVATQKSKFKDTKKKQLLDKIATIIEEIDSIKPKFSTFFLKVDKLVQEKGSHNKLRIHNEEEFPIINEEIKNLLSVWEEFSNTFQNLVNIFSEIEKNLFIEYETHSANLRTIEQRIAEYYNILFFFFNPTWEENALWLSHFNSTDKNYPAGIINMAPLNIDEILFNNLYNKINSAVFTSATMAIRGKFKYYASRMGLDKLEYLNELVVESPFDYQKQSVVLVAGSLPDPKDKYFTDQSLDIIKNSINIIKKGVMTLFTSYRDLNNAHESLSSEE